MFIALFVPLKRLLAEKRISLSRTNEKYFINSCQSDYPFTSK